MYLFVLNTLVRKLFTILTKINTTNINLSEIDTVILAGGLGTRLQPVLQNKPKCLAPINGTPFIDILLDYCIVQGLKRFILCVGYLKEQVIEHLSGRNDCEINFSKEDEPLGTGGAISNAEGLIKSDDFFVMNGDTLAKGYYPALIQFHLSKSSLVTIAGSQLLPKNEKTDFGHIVFDNFDRITSFSEKNRGYSKIKVWTNTGMYVFNKKVFGFLPNKQKFSLEIDFFEKKTGEISFLIFRSDFDFFDIGTPERFHSYQ